MAFADELAALKADLKEHHISVDEVLTVAGVNRSSWTRWGGKHMPRLDRWDAVKAAAAEKIRERQLQRDAA